VIRRAKLKDVKAIHGLIAEQAANGHLLPRAISDLYGRFRDFIVFREEDEDEIVGCGSLHVVWEDLAEIKSLAVTPAREGRGVGTELIEHLLQDARDIEVTRVFVLTYRPGLFERLGFTRMDKSRLPHKIWADCIGCTKFPECDEIALVRNP
jgi:amino-acid N-acetyltransferase